MKRQTNKRKNKKFDTKMQANLLIVFCVVILVFITLIGRLIFLNNKDGERYAKRVLAQQTYVSNVIPYKRGDIVDRKGTILATSEKVYNIILDPYLIIEKVEKEEPYKEPTMNALVTCFGIDRDEIADILDAKKDKRYVILKKELTYDEVESYNQYIEKLKEKDKEEKSKIADKIKGIWFEEEYIRKYPLKTVASDVLGFTSKGNVGVWGIEEYYNEELNGSNGREYGYFDEQLNLDRTANNAVNGNTIVSTIDSNVQAIIEEEIKDFNEKTGSSQTAVVAMNPQNGEVLAMASYPEYDLNNSRDLTPFYTKNQINDMSTEESLKALNEIWRNYTISNAFEPGSTFKPFTMAAAFEEGIVYGSETYYCDGFEEVNGVRINCSKTSGHGTITIEEALMYSCNDALMQIAAKSGRNVFKKYLDHFGFGTKTGIDLPGEESGLVFTAKQLNPIELATSSFGQGQTTNMIQMITAFSSAINGGSYYKPHVVKQILNEHGATVENIEASLMKETVSKRTSDLIREYLYQTVANGTAKGAQVTGYTIGGKTGTAEKTPRGNKKYLVSFIGFAPAENPSLAIYVLVDEPNVIRQDDSSIATKMAGRILEKILPFLEIYPTNDVDSNSTEENTTEENITEENTTEENTTEENSADE